MNIVQFGGEKMNKIVTSREAILEVSQKIASEKGLQAINIRTVAKECNVSVGSIYNYFPSKADLVIATIEQVWKSFFHMRDACYQFQNFIDCVEWVFQTIQKGTREYPGFFLAHAQGLDNEGTYQGKEMMDRYFKHIQDGLLYVLHQDIKVNKSTFTESMSEEDFIHFVFTNMLNLLSQNEQSCHILKEIIKRVIY